MTVLRYNRFYYDPLPSNVKIDESPIHGHGIFAKEDIKSKTDLGSTHIKYPMIIGYIRTPLGGFINHDEKNPNCVAYECGKFLKLKTIKDIRLGEELTLNYSLYDPCKNYKCSDDN